VTFLLDLSKRFEKMASAAAEKSFSPEKYDLTCHVAQNVTRI
jgi:hypothetical protein